MRHAIACVSLVLALLANGNAASIFDGDPVDPGSGLPYPILPGVPLILPGPDGRFRPPVVVSETIGDVDLVIRSGSLGIGPVMPPPVASPPLVVAGGVRVTSGGEVPFTVIASSGGLGVGVPLGGTSLDLIPVIVFAWADHDGDGVIGPTNDDPDGAADNERELQEAEFPVGRQAAVFSGGVAQGSIAIQRGAPASAGGLTVVLTAVAYIGGYTNPAFPDVPDGPPVGTMLPFFPKLGVGDVIDGCGCAGRAEPDVRLGVDLEPAFEVPVSVPPLGTPFALPVDGSSPTIDRATSVAGPVSRVRFVRPSIAAGFPPPDNGEVALYRGAGGALYEAQTSASLVDDGPGNRAALRLVPVDVLDNITDPSSPVAATLVAGPGIVIAAPDTDGDPTRETVSIGSAAGLLVELDDSGCANDSGTASTLTVMTGGFPTEVLALQLTAGAGTGCSVSPVIKGATIVGQPPAIERGCTAPQTLVAVIDGPAVTATATLKANGSPVAVVDLKATRAQGGGSLPPGPVYQGRFRLTDPPLGQLEIAVTATNSSGSTAPLTLSYPILDDVPPSVTNLTILPTSLPAGVRTPVTVTAQVADGCGSSRVQAEIDRGSGFRRLARLTDKGRHGDAVAGDGIFTVQRRLSMKTPGTYPVRVLVRDSQRTITTTAPSPMTVTP